MSNDKPTIHRERLEEQYSVLTETQVNNFSPKEKKETKMKKKSTKKKNPNSKGKKATSRERSNSKKSTRSNLSATQPVEKSINLVRVGSSHNQINKLRSPKALFSKTCTLSSPIQKK